MIAFIPARSGSSVKDKNIRKVKGKPLLVYAIEKAREAGIKRIIVNTDSKEYGEIARNAGAEVMIRPGELAGDTTSMFEVLKNEIPKIKPVPEQVLLLQPTYFGGSARHLRKAISEIKDYDSLISVKRVPEEFHPAVVIVDNKMALNNVPISKRITRRQDHPDAYVPTGEVYLFKTKNLEDNSFYGNNVFLMETSEEGININEEEDFDLCK